MTFLAFLAAGSIAGQALGSTEGGAALIPLPRWLPIAEKQTLNRVFGGATPTHRSYILYPRNIAVVFEFDHVVRCRSAARQVLTLSRAET
jgi:hypothetical protein